MPVTGNLCAVLFSVWITSNHVDGKAIVEGGRSQPNAETIRYCGVRLRLEIESICRHLSTLNSNYGLYRPPHPTVIPGKFVQVFKSLRSFLIIHDQI